MELTGIGRITSLKQETTDKGKKYLAVMIEGTGWKFPQKMWRSTDCKEGDNVRWSLEQNGKYYNLIGLQHASSDEAHQAEVKAEKKDNTIARLAVLKAVGQIAPTLDCNTDYTFWKLVGELETYAVHGKMPDHYKPEEKSGPEPF